MFVIYAEIKIIKYLFPQVVPQSTMPMRQADSHTTKYHHLMQRQPPPGTCPDVAVATHRNHRGYLLKLVQYARMSHIARVQDRTHLLLPKTQQSGLWNASHPFRHMRISHHPQRNPGS